MLNTFKHVGTKTPENVLSFSCPPTGRGPKPGFVFLSVSSDPELPRASPPPPPPPIFDRDARRPLILLSRSSGVVSTDCASTSSEFPLFEIRRIKALCHGAATARPLEPSFWESSREAGKMELRRSSSWAMSAAVRVWKVGRRVDGAVEEALVEAALLEGEPSLRLDILSLVPSEGDIEVVGKPERRASVLPAQAVHNNADRG